MKSRLLQRGFLSLLVVQFFGAANDNVLKTILVFLVVDGVWRGELGEGGQGIVSLCMFVPFILLSGYAGQFADRNSKRRVTMIVKILEVPIAIIALVGFWTQNLWVTLVAMLSLASQSAFFGPAKYGMIPELVAPGDLSRANGTINMLTNIAVIGGTVIAGFVADAYSPQADEHGAMAAGVLWLPGVILVGLAGLGLVAAFFLPPLEPGDRTLQYRLNPLHSYIQAIREMARGPLLTVALAWGYFYFLAGLALLIVPEYTIVLEIDRGQASYLLGILGLAIGIGSVVAGLVSGHHIEPRLIPVGAIGISLFFLLMGLNASSFGVVAALIFGAGLFAGAYIIPLQAMLQHLSPDDERGRFLGTANAISFAFLSAASLLYVVIRPLFGDAPHRIFIVCAILMLAGAGVFLLRLRGMMRPMATDGTPADA